MEYKKINRTAAMLLAHLHSTNKTFFTLKEVRQGLPQIADRQRFQTLKRMVEDGLVLKVKPGLYTIIPYELPATGSFLPNWHTLASQLAQGHPHYIGYYTALNMYHLTTQPWNLEYIVTAKQVVPSTLKVRYSKFQFITHHPKRFFGYEDIWVNKFEKVPCSDIEKTILDCLYLPQYAAGIGEVAKAIYLAKKQLNFEKLLGYTKRFRSQAVTKRLGFLLELLEIDTNIINTMHDSITSSYVLLDPTMMKEGKYTNRWKLRINIDRNEIVESLYT